MCVPFGLYVLRLCYILKSLILIIALLDFLFERVNPFFLLNADEESIKFIEKSMEKVHMAFSII